jgi:hypothetical protein
MPTINGKACVANGTPVDKAFSNGKQVYGRNLLLGTAKPLELAVNNGWGIVQYDLIPKYQGGEVTLSFDIELKGITDFNASQGPSMRVVFDSGWGDDYGTSEMEPNYPVDKRWVITKKDATHWHMSITVNATYSEDNPIPSGLRFFYTVAPAGTTGYIVSNATLTAGASTLPCTPAPEDVM